MSDQKSAGTPDEKEAEALVAALNRSAERLQTLWFTFLGITLYFAITVATTTHRTLLLEKSLKLPLVDLELPLIGFYFSGPLIYVAVHGYFLMMLVLLARTALAFEATLLRIEISDRLSQPDLENSVGTKERRERFRMRLENTIFLQIVAGAERESFGTNGQILRFMAFVSIVFAPVAILVLFQLMFLPYQHDWLTWWHRALVAVDIFYLLALWQTSGYQWLPHRDEYSLYRSPEFMDPVNFENGRILRQLERILFDRHLINISWRLLSLSGWPVATMVLVFSFVVARHPGEWPGDEIKTRSSQEASQFAASLLDDLPRYLLGGDVGSGGNQEKNWSTERGLFPNRLWLRQEIIFQETDTKHAAAMNQIIDSCDTTRRLYAETLKNRNLINANFTGADLRYFNFSDTRITGAIFDLAKLDGASLSRSKGKIETSFYKSEMPDADISSADLAFPFFNGANLTRACLKEARFKKASFVGSILRHAKLDNSDFSGANLSRAQLQGATAAGTRWDRAVLDNAFLAGAHLQAISLIGASLGPVYEVA